MGVDEKKQAEAESAIVTMCLTGYRDTIKKLTTTLIVVAVCWLCTVAGFLYYLSQYEVQVTSYGNLENSKINTSTGQQSDTMTNYFQNGVKDDGADKK